MPRDMCMRCRRPTVVCWCPWTTSIPTRTRVVFFQHPREREVAIGTARMASLCLEGSELHVGVRWSGTPTLARVLGDPSRPPALLWPGEGAIDVALAPPPGPVTLVVVDGTWAQAKKLVRSNPELDALPRYSFTPREPGRYRIRREPSADCRSTIEALAEVLGVLEGDRERFLPLLRPFDAMVDMQLEQHALHQRARTRLRPRRVRQRVPPIFAERPSDLVCVAGEVTEEGERALVYWVAQRIATGELFSATVASSISSRMVKHTQLAVDRFAAGVSLAELVERWNAFVRKSDIVCAWGQCAIGRLLAAGGELPRTRFDLRPIVRGLAGHRVGALEDHHATLGAPARSQLDGRAGLRLAMLGDVVRTVVAIADEDASRSATLAS
jgi:tRNA-uridine aminocarboxypropyltransferase